MNDIHHFKKSCIHHNQSLRFYCESCEEPICQECFHIGPHNNKLHRIVNLIDAFRKNFSRVDSTIVRFVNAKYEEVYKQMQKIEMKVDEVKNNKKLIERDIRSEYQMMLERLTSEEGTKLAVLQNEQSVLNKEVNNIQQLLIYVDSIKRSDSPDMIGFLLRFKEIAESIEVIMSRQVKSGNIIRRDRR